MLFRVTSALPMGFLPDFHPHKLMINYSMIKLFPFLPSLGSIGPKTDDMLGGFTKMAISPLIIVRFSKFKIWRAQRFGADQTDVTMTSRVTSRARWRHARVTQFLDLSCYATLTVANVILIPWLPIWWRSNNLYFGCAKTQNLVPKK